MLALHRAKKAQVAAASLGNEDLEQFLFSAVSGSLHVIVRFLNMRVLRR
jgi:hypothetical protein